MDIRKRVEALRRMTPATGCNVVGVDDFEAEGEELYLVAHVATRAQAEALIASRHETNPEEVLHVYEAEKS